MHVGNVWRRTVPRWQREVWWGSHDKKKAVRACAGGAVACVSDGRSAVVGTRLEHRLRVGGVLDAHTRSGGRPGCWRHAAGARSRPCRACAQGHLYQAGITRELCCRRRRQARAAPQDLREALALGSKLQQEGPHSRGRATFRRGLRAARDLLWPVPASALQRNPRTDHPVCRPPPHGTRSLARSARASCLRAAHPLGHRLGAADGQGCVVLLLG